MQKTGSFEDRGCQERQEQVGVRQQRQRNENRNENNVEGKDKNGINAPAGRLCREVKLRVTAKNKNTLNEKTSKDITSICLREGARWLGEHSAM